MFTALFNQQTETKWRNLLFLTVAEGIQRHTAYLNPEIHSTISSSFRRHILLKQLHQSENRDDGKWKGTLLPWQHLRNLSNGCTWRGHAHACCDLVPPLERLPTTSINSEMTTPNWTERDKPERYRMPMFQGAYHGCGRLKPPQRTGRLGLAKRRCGCGGGGATKCEAGWRRRPTGDAFCSAREWNPIGLVV